MSDLGDLVRDLQAKVDNGRADLDRLSAYYRAEQPLTFMHPGVTAQVGDRLKPLAINWPRVVLDAVHERLQVRGFRLDPKAAPDAAVWDLWQSNNLDVKHRIAQRTALKHGRAFLIAWSGERFPVLSVESATQVAVARDAATGAVTAGFKMWQGKAGQLSSRRATLYLADVVLRLTAANDRAYPHLFGPWRVFDEVEHPVGRVPVVPLVNRPDLDLPDGESEMCDVLPIADAVNKLSTDMMTSAEFHATPRRWALGVEPPRDPETGELVPSWRQVAGHIWTNVNENAKVGQFPEADLGNFVNAITLLERQIAALGKVPPHYLGITGENPASADAIRSAEASLVMMTREKMDPFGASWEEAMRLLMAFRDGTEVDPALDTMETVWADPETRTIAQAADAAVKLRTARIISTRQAQEDIGYGPTQQERMAAELAAEDALEPAAALADALNRQTGTPAA